MVQDKTSYLEIATGGIAAHGNDILNPAVRNDKEGLSLPQNGLHIVKSLGLAHHKFRGGHGTFCQKPPVVGLVAQGQGLVGGADMHFVDAYHSTHPQGRNADLVLGALALAGPAAVLGGLGPHLPDGIKQHMGGAAGGIHLAGVWISTISMSASGKAAAACLARRQSMAMPRLTLPV